MGKTFLPGEKVVLFYSSGNRDAARFDHPWTFDLQRTDNDHVAFGGGGPHSCLGHFLARTQIRAMFRELLGRFPEFTVGTSSYLAGNFIHGVTSLTVQV